MIGDVPASSVRSYLNLNTPETFERTGRGKYRLRSNAGGRSANTPIVSAKIGKATIYQADCFEWLSKQPERSIHAFVTDPPYGIVEYSEKEQLKLRAGRGGVWRIPPSFDGHVRAPLPRFTVLGENDRRAMHVFFKRLAVQIHRVAVPGANIVVAANPLLAHVVACAMIEGGLELRGYLARQVMTMRGGDRPKNAHHEFDGVSVMPRSQWEPWVVLRNPLDGRVQDNLRRWGTGGFRRPSAEQPFGDMIKSRPTPSSERKIANHPSLKPQAFMRQVVRASLPLGKGTICDPFMGAGSTMAAANAVGYESHGIELDETYFALARGAIKKLAAVEVGESNLG
jgi:site-specific DNA-methyltransferase (adenine-specific)